MRKKERNTPSQQGPAPAVAWCLCVNDDVCCLQSVQSVQQCKKVRWSDVCSRRLCLSVPAEVWRGTSPHFSKRVTLLFFFFCVLSFLESDWWQRKPLFLPTTDSSVACKYPQHSIGVMALSQTSPDRLKEYIVFYRRLKIKKIVH